ncbi:protein of unknown function [Agreia sp. COWG]|nr:protein of unknown function [Agreia sp. COWG]
MVIFLVFMGVLAAASIVLTVRDLVRDGYRRIPVSRGDDSWRGW